jgi:hypothetical protein
MSADLATLSPTLPTVPAQSNPFEAMRLALIKRLLELKAPKAYPSFPSPGHHEGVAQHIRDAALIFDEWLAAVGFQVSDNATCNIDMRVFEDTFTAAIEGNATFEVDRAAESLLEGRRVA